MIRTLLLFDIDGTLLKTGGAGMRAMYRVAERLYGPGFSWEGVIASGHMDPLIFSEALAINRIDEDPAHHRRFHDQYVIELERELDRSRHAIQIMPGILQTLAMLRRREQDRGDVMLGLLTGNYTRAVPIKLAAIGVNPAWFSITAFGDEAPTRAGLVELAMRRYEHQTGDRADPRRVIIIGDTPRDVACAHAHGCVALAVATGGHDVNELRRVGADVVVPDLGDPAPLLELIDGAAGAPANS